MGGGTAVGAEWALVGRDATVAAALSALRAGTGTVLVGPAGVGKSRLAREIVDRAEARGRVATRITGTRSAASIPLGALAPHLPVPGEREVDRADMLRLASEALGVQGDDTLVLAIDDAHLLDDASATVVHQLVAAGGGSVVATVRSGEPCPDPVTALWKDGHARRVDLEPLDREEVESLVETGLGGPADGTAMRVLWESSRGNPLFLRELVEGALDAGLLDDRGGIWQLRRPEVVTPRLVDLVEARLDRLDDAEREVLVFLAVGDELPVRLLEDLGHGPRLAGLEASGLLVTVRDRRRLSARLAHPLHQQVLDHQTTDGHRSRVATVLAEALTGHGARRRDDVLRLALWRLAGSEHGDPDLLAEAARRMAVVHHDELAVRLSRAALDEGGGLGARVVNGAGLARLGRVEEAEEVLAAADLGPATDAERVALTVARTDNLFWALGDLDTTLGVIDGVRAGLTDPEADAELGVNAAVYQFMSGRPGDAITLLEPVMDAAPDRVVVTAAMALAPSLAVTGRGEDGAAFVERAIAIRRSLEEPVRLTELSMLHMSHGFVLAAAGRIEEAVAAARRGYDLAVERRDRHGEAWCAMVLTLASHQAGRVRACARWAAEGAATFTEVGMDALARVCRAGRMHALSLLGDAEAARGLRVEVEAGEDRFATLEPEVLRALAWERATSGDEPAAVEMLLDAADRSGEVGACFYEAVVLHDVVRLGRADDVADRLADAARGQQSAVMATMADHGRAAAAGDGTGLGAVSDRFVDHGAALLAAEAAAQSAGAHASGGDERTGRRWARRSAEVMATIDPVRTPALALAGGAGRLTPREREVATASAEGRSNREVAEKLGVSVRTVETHLHRVYDKLGTDRAGLPAALDPTAD